MYIPLIRICIYRNNSQFNLPSVPRGYWKTPKHYLKGSLLYLWDKMDQAYSVCGTITLVFAAGHCRMLTCWARSSVLLFSFTVFLLWNNWAKLLCNSSCAILTKEKWKRKWLQRHVAPDHHSIPISQHTCTHTHQLIMRCATFIMSAKAWICGKVTWESPLTAD